MTQVQLRPVALLAPPVYGEPGASRVLAPPLYGDGVDEVWSTRPSAPSGRRLQIGLRLAVVAVCAALPWAVPQVPGLLAGAFSAPAPAATVRTAPVVPEVTLPAPAPVRPAPPTGRPLASAGAPVTVVVPRLGITSQVVPISGQSGELVPPDDPQLLGWWREGARAGSATGSTVVTGHTVSSGGGAFDHLGALRTGDRVRLRTRSGTIEYRVRESRDLPVAELARQADAIFRQTGAGRLVLITCSDFDGKVYRSNAVVYADPVGELPRRGR